MTAQREYVLGTDDAEYQRLGLQHRLWSDLAQQTWSRACIAPRQRVLDVGSGPGFAAFDLAQIVGPRGLVCAVDESAAFIERLREQTEPRGLTNIEAHVGDVQRLTDLPLDRGSFDFAWARWVLCFVPDPIAVVRGVAALLKPGGRFAIHDYFNYEIMTLAPRSAAFSRVIKAVGESWRARGGDPDIAGRLPRMLAECGLHVDVLRAHHRIARPQDTMWAWPDAFWANFVPRLAEGGLITQAEADAFFRDWRAAAADPHSFIELPVVYEIIAIKE